MEAPRAAESDIQPRVNRTGTHSCLTCTNPVTAVDNLVGGDLTDVLIGVMKEKGHEVAVEDRAGGTPAKPKRDLIFNGTRYTEPSKRRVCIPCRSPASLGAKEQRPPPKKKAVWQQQMTKWSGSSSGAASYSGLASSASSGGIKLERGDRCLRY